MVLTPVKVSVTVFAPAPKVTELVPDPLVQTEQLNVPVVENAVLNAKSPLGRITNGSACVDIEVKRQKKAARSSFLMETYLG
jgi:hypothetical protein